MAKTKNYAGPVWQSQTLKQSFIILSDAKETLPQIRTGKYFTGNKAVRIDDEKLALINLSKKPDNYPYDFVLI